MKHKHAENMIAYGQDAMETDKPWERWQVRLGHDGARWHDIECECTWNPNWEYRRKPRTININGFEVPEPVREPLKLCEEYHYVNFGALFTGGGVAADKWADTAVDLARLRAGIIHLPSEAAELHAKALLSFTENP